MDDGKGGLFYDSSVGEAVIGNRYRFRHSDSPILMHRRLRSDKNVAARTQWKYLCLLPTFLYLCLKIGLSEWLKYCKMLSMTTSRLEAGDL